MYIFSRSLRLVPGDLRNQMAWATAVTEKVNQISEVPVLLWTMFASPQAETVAWSASLPSLATLEAMDDKLAADDGYLSLVAEGAKHVQAGTVTDQLVEIIHATGEPDPTNLRYVTAGQATAAPGRMAKAAEVGIRMTEKMAEVTGTPMSFGTLVTGPTSTFQFASYYESIEQVEEAARRIRSDASLLALFDGEGTEVFSAEPTEAVIVRRVM